MILKMNILKKKQIPQILASIGESPDRESPDTDVHILFFAWPGIS